MGEPAAVMTAAIRRSLSCQFALATSKAMRVSAPHAERPSNAMWVDGVASQASASSGRSPVARYSTCPPRAKVRVVRSVGWPGVDGRLPHHRPWFR